MFHSIYTWMIFAAAGVIGAWKLWDSAENLGKRLGRLFPKTESDYRLQYHGVQTIVGVPPARGRGPFTAEVRIFLNNPHDETLRIFAERMDTTFGNETSHRSADALAQMGVGPKTTNAVVHGSQVRIQPVVGQDLQGRLDCLILYGPVKENGTCDFKFKLIVKGVLILRFYANGKSESGFLPDPDSEVPVVFEEELAYRDEEGFHFKERS